LFLKNSDSISYPFTNKPSLEEQTLKTSGLLILIPKLEFEAAMTRNRVVRREFNALPPGLRMQLLRMLNQCRAPETLHKRINRTVEIMLGRALRRSRKKSPDRKLS